MGATATFTRSGAAPSSARPGSPLVIPPDYAFFCLSRLQSSAILTPLNLERACSYGVASLKSASLLRKAWAPLGKELLRQKEGSVLVGSVLVLRLLDTGFCFQGLFCQV